MGSARNMAADLYQMHLHGLGIGTRQEEGRARAPCRTDGPEYVGILIALISRQSWSCAASRPQARSAIFLTNTRLVLPPDFDWLLVG